MRRLFSVVVVIAFSLVLSGCAVGASSGQEVHISDSGFNPAQVTVKTGGKVTWTNDGAAAHTVTTNEVDSGGLSPSKTYSRTFDTAGTYDYICRYHPTETGTVVVR